MFRPYEVNIERYRYRAHRSRPHWSSATTHRSPHPWRAGAAGSHHRSLDTTGDIADPDVAMRHTLVSFARRWLELHDEIKIHTRHLKTLTTRAAPQRLASALASTVPDDHRW